MPLYAGPSYPVDDMHIGPPDALLWQALEVSPDVADSLHHWYPAAQEQETILYFGIFRGRQPVGQILLHDMDMQTGESLIGYHLFRAQDRGQGIGTQALRLLQKFVQEQTKLKRLIIITSKDNLASQRIAVKCEFGFVGGAREDSNNLVVFAWDVERTGEGERNERK